MISVINRAHGKEGEEEEAGMTFESVRMRLKLSLKKLLKAVVIQGVEISAKLGVQFSLKKLKVGVLRVQSQMPIFPAKALMKYPKMGFVWVH